MTITREDFIHRRKVLMDNIADGLIVFSANQVLPRNYGANSFPFRQDSTFLYFSGIDISGVFLLFDCSSGTVFLAGQEPGIEDTIWSGKQKKLKEWAEESGINEVLTTGQLNEKLYRDKAAGRTIHFIPPYSADKNVIFSRLLGISTDEIKSKASIELIKAIIAQRSVKSEAEVSEIESAINQVTGPMHIEAMKMAVEGKYEYEIVAGMYRVAKAKDLEFAYPVICSVRGEVLHNEQHRNRLKKGQLLLTDAGVESRNHYASDITRITPVGGKFSSQQKEIYQVVLTAQQEAIKKLKPGIRYFDIHTEAAQDIVEGLKAIGLMRGDAEEAVNAGAHALFFPHGLGHMLGLDVHDMEDLGEDYVGYDESTVRSKQFGTAYLRLAKQLKSGYVLTVEPGIYFIPALINQWQENKTLDRFINYERLSEYLEFGGVRIEDNVVITESGCRILGNAIIKSVDGIEALFT